MKLNSLHNDRRHNVVFENFIRKLKNLLDKRVLSEGRKIITTVEIVDDDPEPTISSTKIDVPDHTRNEFIEKAKQLGEFENPIWVEQLVNGVKQAGVQGLDTVCDGDQPVSRSDIRKLIDLLVGLVGNGK